MIQEEEVVQSQVEAPAEAEESIATDTEINKEPQVQSEQFEASENNREVNIRNLRISNERAEREKAELEQQLKQIQEQQAAKNERPEYGEEDFVEGKHLRKEVDAVRAQLKNFEKQAIVQADENRLKSRYSDFDKVVNEKTLASLKESDPEFAETIAYSSGSLYARGSSTYKKIKDLGIYIEDKHEKDRAITQQNAAKPRPLNSVSPQQGESPLSMANAFAGGLTPELKKQLWKEMQEAAKRS